VLTNPLFYVSTALVGLIFFIEWFRWKERVAHREQTDTLIKQLMAKNLTEYEVAKKMEQGETYHSIPGSDKHEAEIERRRGE